MTHIAIGAANEMDFSDVVAPNLAKVSHTSPMDENRLRDLDTISDYHKVVIVDGTVAAFVIAMRDGCGYVNENYVWFAARFSGSLYVDRIIVGNRSRGLRLGPLLYGDLFDYARSNDIATIACEYNVVPPNEPSRVFHDKFGFREVGRHWLDNGAKQVSLQVART